MLVREVENRIEKSGDFVSNNFRIKASAKAFRILSEQLYSDKILAILRELSCNAYDAHVAAKTLDRPFQVHLPNNFEPFFSIRDFGTGLSHEDIMVVYTTYFESTKTMSNEMIGCLGLGSKTPFAYTDTFSVTSFHNGMKREYSAYIGNGGVPAIDLITEEETTEPNGLEVHMDVKRQDFDEFERKAKKIYKYFTLQPRIVGRSIKIDVPIKLLEGTNWYRTKNEDNWSDIGSSYAVMGNVVYPIDTSKFTNQELSNKHRALLNSKFHINFKIGELEITPSREHLSYDDVTKRGIIDKLDAIITEAEVIISNKMKNCKNGWERACLYTDLRHEPEYNGFDNFIDIKKILGNVGSTTIVFDANKDKEVKIVRFGYHYGRVSTRVTDTIYAGTSQSIIINDLSKGSHMRCKEHARTTKQDVVLVTFIDDGLVVGSAKTKFETKMDCVGTVFQNSSTLPKPTPIGGKSGNKTINVYKIDPVSGNVVQEKVDLSKPGLYLSVYKNYIEKPKFQINGSHNLTTIGKFVNEVKKLINCVDDVYIFRTDIMKRLKLPKYKTVKWVNFYEMSQGKVNQAVINGGIADIVTNTDVDMHDRTFGGLQKYLSNSTGPLINYLQNIVKIKTMRANKGLMSLRDIAKTFNVTPVSTINLDNEKDNILTKYPLLGILESIYDGSKWYPNLAEYVKMVDKS